MAGAKTAGWVQLGAAADEFLEVRDIIASPRHDVEVEMSHLALGLAQAVGGIEDSLQELYERMQRLHQKIDRIEKKIGSV